MCLLGEKLCSIYAERIAVTFGVDCTCSFSFQEKVACLTDNDARLALDPNDKYKIQVENFHTRINNIVFKTYITILLLHPLSVFHVSYSQFCDLTDKATWAWRCSFSSLFKWLA